MSPVLSSAAQSAPAGSRLWLLWWRRPGSCSVSLWSCLPSLFLSVPAFSRTSCLLRMCPDRTAAVCHCRLQCCFRLQDPPVLLKQVSHCLRVCLLIRVVTMVALASWGSAEGPMVFSVMLTYQGSHVVVASAVMWYSACAETVVCVCSREQPLRGVQEKSNCFEVPKPLRAGWELSYSNIPLMIVCL